MTSSDNVLQKQFRRGYLRVLFPAGIGMALALAGDLTLYAVLPAYADKLGISLATVGLLLSANRLIRFLSNPLVGLLANRVGRRSLVLTGFAVGLLSTVLYVTQNLWIIFIGRLLWGISWSMMYIGIYCIILDITDEHDRGWGTGMLQTFYFIGIGVTPVLGGLFSGWLGFRGGLLACAALQGIGLMGAIACLPETYAPASLSISQMPIKRQVLEVLSRVKTVSFGWLLRHREVIVANYMYMATLFVGDGIIMSTITLYLQQRYGDALTLGSTVLPITALGGGLLAMRALISGGTAPLTGHWSDRSGTRWTFAAWGAVVTVGGCILLAFDGGFGMLVLGIVLAAFGSGMLLAVLPAIISSTPGQQGSLAMGVLTTSGDIGSATAPLIGFAMLKILPLSILYLVSGGLLVIGMAASFVVGRQTSLFPTVGDHSPPN